MNIIRAVWWLQTQPGIKITIGKNRQVTITDGVNVEATATGLIRCVNNVQKILQELNNEKKHNSVSSSGDMCG